MSGLSALTHLKARSDALQTDSAAASAAFKRFWAVALPHFEQHGAPQDVIAAGAVFSAAYSAFGHSAVAFGEALSAFTEND